MKPGKLSPAAEPSPVGASQPGPAGPSIPPEAERSWVGLDDFRNRRYSPGRSWPVRAGWYMVSLIVFESGWFPIHAFKAWLLRRFGARIGKGLVIKPQVRIKYPWRLTVGDHCWIGQGAWIDNLDDVELGSHVCISQGVYFCTGSHDHRRRTFDLITAPIVVQNGAWIGAQAMLLPGCTVGANSLVAAGTVVRFDVGRAQVVAGNPAQVVSGRDEPSS